MKHIAQWLLCLCLAALITPVFAGESQFGYVYTTDLLPKGKPEIEQWMTWRHGRANGEFEAWELRTALEYGVTDNFQLAAYTNYHKLHAFHNGADGTTVPSENFAEIQPGPDDDLNTSKFLGVSVEGIYRVLSPYRDPIGLALYLEPTVGKGLREMEEKLLLQKNYLDDRLILAGNVTFSQEVRLLPADPSADPDDEESRSHWDHETDMNFSVGASYRFIENWSGGFEFMNEREFSSLYPFQSEERTNSAYYVGPTFHYGGKRIFVTATFLKQLPWATDYTADDPSAVVNGRSNADDFENYRIRIKIGIPFN